MNQSKNGVSKLLCSFLQNSFSIKIMNQHSSDAIKGIIESFEKKYLRMQAMEEEKLQLEIGRQWNYKKQQFILLSSPPTIPDQQTPPLQGETAFFYNIVMLLFPQISSQSALDIKIMDTLFFLPDHSVYYVLNDHKKGLIRIKNKNVSVCEMFLKKKNKKKEGPYRSRQNLKSRSMFSITAEQKSQKSIGNSLDYVALLKYKDGNFLRLKQGELRSIFTNPLYANQKFKHNNCTQYIQNLPSEGSEECQIHYQWQRFKDDPLMHMVLSMQRGKNTYGDRETAKKYILSQNPSVLLYFIAFEVCTYICMHYNKRLEKGNFHFVKEADNWCLAGIEAAQISNLERNQFVRTDLWQKNKKVNFEQIPQSKAKIIFQQKQETHSELYRQIEGYFDKTNHDIKRDLLNFVSTKIENVRKVKDKNLSKAIFQIIHPQTNKNLYDLLDSPKHLATIIQQPPTHRKKIYQIDESQNIKPLLKHKKVRTPFLQQLLKRQKEKQQYVYRGIQTT